MIIIEANQIPYHKMKIITDGFKAMDAASWGLVNGVRFRVKANTITAYQQFLPGLPAYQIRTKNLDAQTVNYIIDLITPAIL